VLQLCTMNNLPGGGASCFLWCREHTRATHCIMRCAAIGMKEQVWLLACTAAACAAQS